MVGPYLVRPRRHSFSDVFLNKFGLIRLGLGVFWRPIFSLVVAGLCIGPKARCLTWEFHPYNIYIYIYIYIYIMGWVQVISSVILSNITSPNIFLIRCEF